MKRAFLVSTIALAFWALLFSACSDDTGPGSSREPGTILVPAEMTLEEAADQAVAGDTLFIADLVITLAATVEFQSSQTPLLVRGSKNYPLITTLADTPPLRFVEPKEGTRVEGLLLSAPGTCIEVIGPGDITVDDCRFTGGSIQVLGKNNGLRLEATNNLMRDAGQFALDVEGGSELFSHGNTIDAAGDCGIRLQSGAVGTVQNCIIHRSTNFGITCLGNASLADTSGCNDIHLSGTAGYSGCAEPESDFDLDPQFCDLDNGVYTLVSLSPCTEINSGGCGRIGAFPAACEPEPASTAAGAPRPESR